MGSVSNLGLTIATNTVGEEKLDQFIKKLDGLYERADSGGDKFGRFGEKVKGFLEDPINSAAEAFKSLTGMVGPMGEALAGVGTVFATVAGASFEAAKHLGTLGTEMSSVSTRTGLTVQEVEKFNFAAKAAGSDISVFEAAMRKLSQGLADNTEEGKAARAQLQLWFGDAERLKPMSQIFQDIGARFAEMASTAERNAAAVALFGRSGIELVPVLSSLKENLQLLQGHQSIWDQQTLEDTKRFHEESLLVEHDIERLKILAEKPLAFTFEIFYKRVFGNGDNETDVSPFTGKFRPPSPRMFDPLDPAMLSAGNIAPGPGDVSRTLSALLGSQADVERGEALYRSLTENAGTREGVEHLLKQAQEAEAGAQRAFDASKDQGSTAVARANTALQAARRKVEAYQNQLAEIDRMREIARRFSQPFIARPVEPDLSKSTPFPGRPPSLNGFQITDAEMDAANADRNQIIGDAARAELEGYSNLDQQNVQRRLASIEAISGHEIRMLEITHSRELDLIDKATAKKLDAIEKEKQAGGDLYDLMQRRQQVLDEQQEAHARMMEEEAQSFRGLAEGFFGAATSRNPSRAIPDFLRGRALSLGSTVFGNVASMAWPHIASLIPHAGDSDSFLGKLLQGTPFAAGGPNAALDHNTTATDLNTKATALLASVMAKVGGMNIPGGAGGSGGFSIPGLGTFGSDVNGITAGGIVSLGAGQPGAYGGMDPGVAAALGVSTPAGTASSASGAGWSAMGTTTQIASVVALGAGTYQGISSIARGGAQNVTSGVGDLAGVAAGALMLAGVSGPAAPILLGVAAAASIASAIMGDPKVRRENQISKTLFTSQYLAPPSENISVGGNGGYADVDAYGNVRSSNFSPYPIVQGSYLDVPRRTVVPGITDSQFGGYSNSPGAITPPIPVPRSAPGPGAAPIIIINAVDTQSFHDALQRNPVSVLDAAHLALNSTHHELVNNLAQRLGMR